MAVFDPDPVDWLNRFIALKAAPVLDMKLDVLVLAAPMALLKLVPTELFSELVRFAIMGVLFCSVLIV